MTTAVRQYLRFVAADLRDGAVLDVDDARRIAEAFDKIAEGQSADIAFGLRLKPGQHRSQEEVYARDDLFRTTARTFWPNANVTEQARQLCRALKHYRNGRWDRDRAAAACPYPSSTLTAHLWRLLRHRDLAIGERQMARILTPATPF
jgi:hypothetical protein